MSLFRYQPAVAAAPYAERRRGNRPAKFAHHREHWDLLLLRNGLLGLFAPLLLLACATPPADSPPRTIAPVTTAAPGMVSAADPRAAAAGRAILQAGGSAADAAIATAIALTVVEPQSSGIGGGGFLIHHDAQKGLTSYDGREEAPSAADPRWFLDPQGAPIDDPSIGGRATGVPGNIRMFALAHSQHGKLPWAKLFDPAIQLARDGYQLSDRGHSAVSGWRTEALALTPWARATFLDESGAAKPVGATIRNPELAGLLEEIARLGPDHFYTGPVADRIVRAVTAASRNPAPMTKGDLATYDAKQREAPCGSYRGHRICGMGPPSSGATTVFAILKQLERFDLAALGPTDARAWHLIAESMRLAYADRAAYLADPEFVSVPTAGLMDPAYLARRSALIGSDRALARVTHGAPPGAPRTVVAPDGETAGTSHMVATDRWGNVASLTSTIEAPWGSGLTVSGMFLNNELTDFSIVPAVNGVAAPNRVEGGKRPRSSMSPTIVYAPDGQVRLALGAAGGATIIMQVAKTIIGVVDWGLSAEDAIALSVMTLAGDGIGVERGTALERMAPALTALGHKVTVRGPSFKANAIEWKDGRWIGAADPRSEGVALGE